MWCQSQTWDIEPGCALVHANHIGARANIDVFILRLHVMNGQDSIEIHGPVRHLAIAFAGPNQGVCWQLEEKHMSSNIFTYSHSYTQPNPSLSLGPICLEVREAKIMSVMDVCTDDIHTLLLAVQMKLTVDPTATLCILGSSIKTSIGLDGKAGEGKVVCQLRKKNICVPWPVCRKKGILPFKNIYV